MQPFYYFMAISLELFIFFDRSVVILAVNLFIFKINFTFPPLLCYMIATCVVNKLLTPGGVEISYLYLRYRYKDIRASNIIISFVDNNSDCSIIITYCRARWRCCTYLLLKTWNLLHETSKYVIYRSIFWIHYLYYSSKCARKYSQDLMNKKIHSLLVKDLSNSYIYHFLRAFLYKR